MPLCTFFSAFKLERIVSIVIWPSSQHYSRTVCGKKKDVSPPKKEVVFGCPSKITAAPPSPAPLPMTLFTQHLIEPTPTLTTHLNHVCPGPIPPSLKHCAYVKSPPPKNTLQRNRPHQIRSRAGVCVVQEKKVTSPPLASSTESGTGAASTPCRLLHHQ